MSRPYNKNRGAVAATKYSSPCKFFLRGSCSNQRCPYLHVRNQTVLQSANHKQEAAQQSNGTVSLISTMLKLFFEKQTQHIYDASTGMLNLSRLSAYDDLAPVASSINFNTRTFCVALCTCIRELVAPPPALLQLDHNDLKSFHQLGKALEEADLHPALRALSLAHNGITSTDVAQELRRFSNLMEVSLVGNPVTESADYKQKFKKHLPWLQGLDGVSMAAPPLELPWPRFFDPQHTSPAHGDLDSIAGGFACGVRGYDDTQRALLHFIHSAVLRPLEMESGPGQLSGIDAVSDVYALNAAFTFSLVTNDAAVSTPSRTAGGAAASAQRDVVREIVGFRMRQTESNHNVLFGLKATTVATGRTSVCAKLEHVLYPKNFAVAHYLHDSPGVVVLDNKSGGGSTSVVGVRHPLSIITMHGVMLWRYRTAGSDADVQHTHLLRDATVIKRNFSRVFTVTSTAPGRWYIVNDMVTLFPFRGADDGDHDSGAATVGSAGVTTAPRVAENVLLRDVHPYDIVFSPATDPRRAARMGRRYRVPAPVVATLCSIVHSDRELGVILVDLVDIPMEAYEQCATLVEMDPVASIFLCRLSNRYGVDQAAGVALLHQCGLDWSAIEQAVTR
ncbi:mRNA export factor MEX67 [Novymonas esmeraldas]|uniref:mRNA export factor MEX67 n=1 Tax=Novymonas esmeraldas TaxID=1808958 RepID=A0AAW0EPL7_9TRYP